MIRLILLTRVSLADEPIMLGEANWIGTSR